LWATEIAGYALAGVCDPHGLSRREALGIPSYASYVNAGVLLLNLTRWRADDLAGRLAQYIEQADSRLVFHDQDAINAVLYPAIKLLDYRWNFQAWMFRPTRTAPAAEGAAIARSRGSPAIVHYTSERKPWLFVMATPQKRLYRHFLAMTDWRDAAPAGRGWSKLGEACFNHLLYYCGSDYTWRRYLVATTPGRIIDRCGRLVAALGRELHRRRLAGGAARLPPSRPVE
jgi:lipopolysaccharide biosynthesis glycosyltransferase